LFLLYGGRRRPGSAVHYAREGEQVTLPERPGNVGRQWEPLDTAPLTFVMTPTQHRRPSRYSNARAKRPGPRRNIVGAVSGTTFGGLWHPTRQSIATDLTLNNRVLHDLCHTIRANRPAAEPIGSMVAHIVRSALARTNAKNDEGMYMRKLISTLALTMALSLPGFASASAEFQAAEDAIARNDYTSAVELLRVAADNGNAIAAEMLGDIFWYGESHYGPGIVQNRAEALTWYRIAAERGSPFAMYVLSQTEQGNEARLHTGGALTQAVR
jgi:hypothetical protein